MNFSKFFTLQLIFLFCHVWPINLFWDFFCWIFHFKSSNDFKLDFLYCLQKFASLCIYPHFAEVYPFPEHWKIFPFELRGKYPVIASVLIYYPAWTKEKLFPTLLGNFLLFLIYLSALWILCFLNYLQPWLYPAFLRGIPTPFTWNCSSPLKIWALYFFYFPHVCLPFSIVSV